MCALPPRLIHRRGKGGALLHSSPGSSPALESQFAGRDKQNPHFNLVGFRRIVDGCGPDSTGPGFDDVLVAAGAEAVATKLRQEIVAAEAAVEEPDLRQTLVQDQASVQRLYDDFKGITDVLKTDLIHLRPTRSARARSFGP
ncbi:imelysin family protein [Corallococcus exercitus]|uniref:imelysin family protein n=1 Tax=Corallococcus exercitus TaxID=2316736 RepID=UPI0020A5D73D|nr:imelysin family protein [Corallococcus exercitus]